MAVNRQAQEPGARLTVVGSPTDKERLAVLERQVSDMRQQVTSLVAQKTELERVLQAISNSASWRITAPLRSCMAALRTMMPLWRSRTVPLALQPIRGVAQHGDEIEIIGQTPALEVLAETSGPKVSGWVLVRGTLRSESTHKFFFLCHPEGEASRDRLKDDLPADQRTWLTFEQDKRTEALTRIPKRLALLRLDPFDVTGSFSIEGFEIQEIGSLQFAASILRKHLGQVWRNPKAIYQKLKKAVAVYREGGFAALRVRLFADNFTSNYQEWVKRFDTLDDKDLSSMQKRIDTFEYKPLISVVMPTFNTPERWLRAAIESVQRQVYPHWELCIADDASTDHNVKVILNEYQAKDARIKLKLLAENGHIARASNAALELASGEFIALLDHDDELTEHALYMIVEELQKHRDADLIYSDEDKLTSYGMRFNPHFKSDWNPDLFLAQNYVCHLGVYRAALVQKLGGFRPGFEGAQDWDLAWRVADASTPQKIRHIPHILYHWRVIEGSTAQSTAHKPYVLEAQRKSVVEHLERSGVKEAQVEILHDISHLRVTFPVPNPAPLVSIIIPTKDQGLYLERCVNSILEKSDYRSVEFVIVDNNSHEQTTFDLFKKLEASAPVRVVRDERPFNFSRLNNLAVQHAKGELIGFLNNDLEVISPAWLSEMVSHAVRPEIGAVGARLWYPNYLLQHAGVVLGIGGVGGHNHKGKVRGDPGYFNRAILPQNLSAVTAACLLMRRAVFDEIGGFDEENLAVAFNDVDLCLKIRARGYRILYTPYAELFHYESVSRGYENTPEKFQRFEHEIAFMKQRWGNVLKTDPYYNPNLTVITEDFTFAFPPRAAKPWRSNA